MAEHGEKPGPQPPKDGAPQDGGAEDIEAFLASLEAEEHGAPAKPAAVKELDPNDPFAAAFAELDALQPDDLPAITPEKQPKPAPADEPQRDKPAERSRKERAAEKQAAKEAQKEQARAEKEHEKAEKERLKAEKRKEKEDAAANQPRLKRWAKTSGLALLMALPAFILAWILGAYLGHLISAGWLIALLASLVAFGLPLLTRHLAKRGRYGWWMLGLGVLLSAAAIAPMPQTAGTTLIEYGHWPATAVTEVSGWRPTNALVQFNSATANLVGGLLVADDSAPTGPLELGTKHSLYKAGTPGGPVPSDTPAEPGTPTPDSPTADSPTADSPTADSPTADAPRQPAAGQETK